MEALENILLGLINKAWDANIREDAGFYQNFLADDALGINNFGIVDKNTLVKLMNQHSGIPFESVKMEDPRVIILTSECALVAYKATIVANRNGEKFTFSDYVTTVFVLRNGEWKGALQQHSRIQDTPHQ